ncbi:MAG: ATPase, T2SS/T4P/T4SS family [Methanobacteriota archaeon]
MTTEEEKKQSAQQTVFNRTDHIPPYQTIEQAVDELLLKNKDKIDTHTSDPFSTKNISCPPTDKDSGVGLDIDRFSPKHKKGHVVYFVRKKTSDKKSDVPEKKSEHHTPKTKIKKRFRFGKPIHKIASIQDASAPSMKKENAPKSEGSEPREPPQIQRLAEPQPIPEEQSKKQDAKEEPAPSIPEIAIQKKTSSQDNKPSPDKKKPSSSDTLSDQIGRVDEKEAQWLDERIKKAVKQRPPETKKVLPKKESVGREKKKYRFDEKIKRQMNAEVEDAKGTLSVASEKEETKQLSETKKEGTLLSKSQMETVAPVVLSGSGKTGFTQEVLLRKSNILQQLGLSETQWDELDFYPLHEPFAYVEIIRDTQSLDKRYILVEVALSNEEAYALKFIQDTLKVVTIDTEEIEVKGVAAYLEEKVRQIVSEYKVEMNPLSMKKITYFLEKHYVGLGVIDALMRDPNIEDISCDGSNVPIFLYHREYGSVKSNIEFKDEDELSGFVVRLAQRCGKHISISEPMLDATMPDGSRIQMTLSAEVTAKGSTFTIRKFREDPFSPPDLIEFNTMSAEMVAYMWMVVENGVNALIAGGTASGKTSTLNALALFIPRDSKIVSIEETREINLPHPNWIPGVARSGFGEVVADKVVGEIDMYDLMKAALRQRPEYILVGEIRGKEAYVLFQAMATGHTTYSTAHADSAQSLIHRLEGKPIEIPRIMLQALDIVCIQVTTRVKNKRARRCKQIIEIIDIDPTTKEILTNEVFRWDPIEDLFIYSGKSYVLENIRADKDMSRDAMTQELKNRAELLHWMNQNNIRDFREVATVLAQFNESPETIMKKIKGSGK